MAIKKLKFSVRTFLTIATVALVAYVVYQNWPDIIDTVQHLKDTNTPHCTVRLEVNIIVLLFLVPEQLFMYYACGQIFFSYLKTKSKKKFSKKEMLLISTELNFVNHAVPAGGLGGLAYLTYRFREFGITAGQSSFLYIFRYAITTVVNYFQALVAIIVLAVLGLIPAEATWIIWVSLLMNAGVFTILGLIIYIASSKKRIEWFGKVIGKLLSWVAKTITIGHKKSFIRREKMEEYFLSIHDCVVTVKKDKKSLLRPTIWGFVYSLCEIGVYYIVACSLGRPDILPVIMVGEAIGSVFDGIVPYGPYELGMSGVMSLLLGGTEEAVAISLIVVVMARALSLMFTIGTGWWPYQKAIRGKE